MDLTCALVKVETVILENSTILPKKEKKNGEILLTL